MSTKGRAVWQTIAAALVVLGAAIFPAAANGRTVSAIRPEGPAFNNPAREGGVQERHRIEAQRAGTYFSLQLCRALGAEDQAVLAGSTLLRAWLLPSAPARLAKPFHRDEHVHQARIQSPTKEPNQPIAQKNASQTKHNARVDESAQTTKPGEEDKHNAEPAHYSYEFTQPQFYIRHIVIEHDATGRGKITFERLNEETPIIEPVELSPVALGRIVGLWNALQFLESKENYQSDKKFPHLGTMRLLMEQGTLKRTAEFNWTNNKEAFALVNEYRRVADQAIFVFDMSIARENQPLNAPKLMEQLELLLKRNGLSDPHQLVPLLRDITTDERLPLIARNHAGRLVKMIEK